MQVRAKRQQVVRAITRHLAEEYQLVVDPDHPMLLRGPDLLIGGKGRLWGVFLTTAAERKAPKELFARTALAKQALPQHAVFVFVTFDEADRRAAQELGSGFDLTVSEHSLPALWQQMQATRSETVSGERASRVRAQAILGEDFRTSLTLVHFERRHGRRDIPSRFPAARVAATWRTHGAEVVKLTGGAPSVAQLRKILYRSTRQNYDIVDGAIMPVLRTPHIAIVDDLPNYRGDPDKPLRAAALAHATIIPSQFEFRLEPIIARIQSRARA